MLKNVSEERWQARSSFSTVDFIFLVYIINAFRRIFHYQAVFLSSSSTLLVRFWTVPMTSDRLSLSSLATR